MASRSQHLDHKMYPLLRPAVLFSLVALGLASAPPDECPLVYCGLSTSASFPFWFEGLQPPSCGMPEFKLTCRDQTPQISISNLTYTVNSVDTYRQTLILSPTDSQLFICRFLTEDSRFNFSPFNPDYGVENLLFFFNCSQNFIPERYLNVNCGKTKNFFIGWREEQQYRNVCQIVSLLPSAATLTVDKGNLTAILAEGFNMRWYAGSGGCIGCESSGGKCRYRTEEKRFGCLCGNRLLPDTCNNNGIKIFGGTVAAIFALLHLVLFVYMARKNKAKRRTRGMFGDGSPLLKNINDPMDENGELHRFDFVTLALATNHFSPQNKLGAGGFGDVYKGILPNGQVIAVKKTSLKSTERMDEFMMEVQLIAKLQHRNLVRLLGCCIEGSERLLVYEFVANKSLDFFIFGDEEKRKLLDWENRLSIIIGVARGLLYLHQDSRLRVIHRDLKAANVLLEDNLNPKISDFGTARIFEREQIQDNTIKIVGTIGYMSPEYVMKGIFSEKSDIFSFGVLVLEILSGRRNKWSSQKEHCMDLLANAWTLCKENQIHKLLDSALDHPTHVGNIAKFAKVGLLCVQEDPDDRPTMQEVVIMLVKDNNIFSEPKRPGFFQPTSFSLENDTLIIKQDLTMTTLVGR